jgi:hypothetical protein
MERRAFLKGSAVAVGIGSLAAKLDGVQSLGGGLGSHPPARSTTGRFIVPSGDVVILTDPAKSAAVFVTPGPAALKGIALSRGATTVLSQSWFGGEELLATDAIETAEEVTPEAVEAWVDGHPGLMLTDTQPAVWPVAEGAVEQPQPLSVDGLELIALGPGRLLTRRVGTHVVYYHEAAKPLPAGTVPLIDDLISLPADPELALPQIKSTISRLRPNVLCCVCAVCAACSLCSGSLHYVGCVGLVGLVGLAGL